jgi:hypothetical protein
MRQIHHTDRKPKSDAFAQMELAGLSSKGEPVIAKESSHYIQWDQPKLVIDAIRKVFEQVRGE